MDEITIANEFGDGTDLQKFLDADYLLTAREIQSIDRTVYKVVRAREVVQQTLPSVKIFSGAKEHKIAIEKELDPPQFTDDFLKEDLDEVRKEISTFYPIYMHKDFALKKVDIDASRNAGYYRPDIKNLQIRATTATIVNYRERCLWRGYDIKGRSSALSFSIDTNSKGILNTTNVQSFAAGGGGDADVGDAGDGPASIAAAISTLTDYHYYGPYWLVMTPKVRAQFIENLNSTTHESDLERMQSMIDENGNGLLRGIKTTPYLLNTAETTSNGAMIMFDPKTPNGEPTAVIGEVYPVTHYPTTQNPLYIKGKVIWAGCSMVMRPYAFTAEDTITQAGS